MSSPPDLPSHVQRIVDEIENEIGEEPDRPPRSSRGAARTAVTAPTVGSRPPSARSCIEIGEDPDRQGLVGTPGPRPPDVHGADRRLPRRSRAADQRRDLRRRLQRDGRRQGHPVLLAVRAPPAAVLRHRGGRLHPARPGHRAVEDPAHRRDVRAPAPGPGAADPADRRVPPGPPRAAGRRRRARGDPPVRGDARRPQARHDHDDLVACSGCSGPATGPGPSSSPTWTAARREPDVDLGLRDRVVLITGAGGGAGPTLARCFAAEGAFVALHHRAGSTAVQSGPRTAAAEIVAAGGRAIAVSARPPSTEQIAAMVERVASRARRRSASS